MRNRPGGFIDPPSPFAPRRAWEAFLAEMLDVVRDHPDWQAAKDAVSEARAALARMAT